MAYRQCASSNSSVPPTPTFTPPHLLVIGFSRYHMAYRQCASFNSSVPPTRTSSLAPVIGFSRHKLADEQRASFSLVSTVQTVHFYTASPPVLTTVTQTFSCDLMYCVGSGVGHLISSTNQSALSASVRLNQSISSLCVCPLVCFPHSFPFLLSPHSQIFAPDF